MPIYEVIRKIETHEAIMVHADSYDEAMNIARKTTEPWHTCYEPGPKYLSSENANTDEIRAGQKIVTANGHYAFRPMPKRFKTSGTK